MAPRRWPIRRRRRCSRISSSGNCCPIWRRAGAGSFGWDIREQAEEIFQQLKLRVPASYRPRVEEMQGWCDERRWLDEQTRYQHWLHGWLLLHAPLSFVLILMTAWHAFITIFHY